MDTSCPKHAEVCNFNPIFKNHQIKPFSVENAILKINGEVVSSIYIDNSNFINIPPHIKPGDEEYNIYISLYSKPV